MSEIYFDVTVVGKKVLVRVHELTGGKKPAILPKIREAVNAGEHQRNNLRQLQCQFSEQSAILHALYHMLNGHDVTADEADFWSTDHGYSIHLDLKKI